MTKNPILNALAASGYILLVGIFFAYVPAFFPEPTNAIAPTVLILSLFVFSAAIMCYIVLSTPLQLFAEGQRKEGVALFFKTLIAFAAISVVLANVAFLLPSGWFPLEV